VLVRLLTVLLPANARYEFGEHFRLLPDVESGTVSTTKHKRDRMKDLWPLGSLQQHLNSLYICL
jgi:hypothetical protein